MSRIFAQLTISLDGFAAGPDDGPDHPLGKGGLDLHRWILSPERTAVDKEFGAGLMTDTGAVVIGRRMADIGIPIWGPDGAFGLPTYIVTHRAAPVLVKGPTTFSYVTTGVAAALLAAKNAAKGKNVAIAGGATVIREALTLGLVDELRLSIAPILLGRGRALFAELGFKGRFTPTQVLRSPMATHTTYQVTN